jgi:hypothetical protein
MPPKRKSRDRELGHLESVIKVTDRLTALGLQPVLVGGMALVLLGSRRVTRDFDFVIENPGERLAAALDAFYDMGLELAAKVDQVGDVTATIGNRRVAAARLRLDRPDSAFFVNRKSGLRIDVLFDFPIPARELADRSIMARTPVGTLQSACEPDLLKLKLIAQANRTLASDALDVSFLEGRRKR